MKNWANQKYRLALYVKGVIKLNLLDGARRFKKYYKKLHNSLTL